MCNMKNKKAMPKPHSDLEGLNYNHIVDGIYIGNNQCCQMHFDTALKNKEGILADISLEEKRLDAPFGVEFYLWMPVIDHTPPSPNQVALGASVLEQLVSMGKKVFVHCKNGHGRASVLVAAYLILKGYTPQDAVALIKKIRPATHLWDAQLKALDEFKKKY